MTRGDGASGLTTTGAVEAPVGVSGKATVRVRYPEADQMGVAHHAYYLIWCELARTRHLAEQGVSYRDLEAEGLRLPVVDVSVRYRVPARFDDLLSVACWVRHVASRTPRFMFRCARRPSADG